MKSSELIALFERMLAEHWAYAWGAARQGVVDCSGAFVWAFKQHGQSIAHGSNAIARELIRAGRMRPIREARPGWALFKHAFDGGEPDKYKADGLGNYKHIALCSRDGARALNAKGEQYGFCSDSLSGYSYAAPLPGVEYEEDEEMNALHQAVVATEKDPLRVRSAPVTGAVIGHVRRGAIVDVFDESGWPYIRYNKLEGYASSEYLQRIDSGTQDGSNPSVVDASGVIFLPISLARQLYEVLGEALSVD